MISVLAHIRPIDPATGARIDVYVGSTSAGIYSGLGGLTWEPAIVSRPKGSLEIFAIDFSPGTQTGKASFEISMSAVRRASARALYWQDAPVIIYNGDEMVWPAPVIMNGIVAKASQDLDGDTLSLNCETSTARIEVDLLTRTFFDLGGIGDAERFNDPLPAGFGICPNVEPVMFDTIRNIAMFDGYGNLLAVNALFEGLSSLGPSLGNYANHAALEAALDAGLIPPGRWATCLSAGMIGLGAPPTGVITGHITCGHGRTGAMIRRVLDVHANIPNGDIETGSFNTIDAAFNFPIHYWTSSQVEVKGLVEAVAAGLNCSFLVTFQNKMAITRLFGGDIVATLTRGGYNVPAVQEWKTNDVIEPFWQIKGRVARPGRVMSREEVNYSDVLVDRGLFVLTEVYRQGNIVWLRDKSQWLYINEVAEAGHVPPYTTDGDIWWARMAPGTLAADILYDDGTSVEALKPSAPGATNGADPNSPFGNGGLTVGNFITLEEQAQSDIAALISEAAETIADVADLQARILAAEGEVDSLTIEVETVGAQASLNALAISNVEGDLASLTSTVETVGAQVTTNSTAISSLNTNVASLSSTVSSQGIMIGSQGSQISSLASAISTAEADIASLETSVSVLGAEVSSNAIAISTANSNVASLTNRVTAGRHNLVKNPSFQDGLNNWSIGGQPGGVAGANSGNNIYGSYGYFYNNGAPLPLGYYYFDSDFIETGASTITATANFASDGSTSGDRTYLEIVWFNGSSEVGVSSGPAVAGPRYFGSGAANRRDIAVTADPPAGANRAKVRLVGQAVSGNCLIFGWQSVKLEFGTEYSSFTEEAVAVQQFQAYQTLDTQYASLSSEVTAVGVTVSETLTAINDVEAGLAGQYLVKVEAGTGVASLEGYASGSSAGWKFKGNNFKFTDNSGGNETDVLTYESGTWKLKDIEVDTLKVNTALIPIIVSQTATVFGTGSLVTLSTTVFTLPRDGIVKISGAALQGFSARPRAYNFEVEINGVVVWAPGGTDPGDTVGIQGNEFCSAGTVTVVLRWSGQPGVDLYAREFVIEAFPGTE